MTPRRRQAPSPSQAADTGGAVPDSSLEELWRGWVERRDPRARERLVVHYSPLVKFVVGRIRSRLPAHVDPADLVSEGLLGLLEAMDRFDPSMGLQFQTFAVPRIRGAILDQLRAADWAPRKVRDQIHSVDRSEDALSQRLGRPPTADEVAAELGIEPGDVRRIHEHRRRAAALSLDERDHDDGAGGAVHDPLDDLDELPAAVRRAVLALPERDQIVLALYYWERLSLAEVGQVLQVTESRVSQLHARATLRLREIVQQDGADDPA